MERGRIVIITGPPGTGKTAAASVIPNEYSFARSAHMHTDDFYSYLFKGAVPPYLPGSQEQNAIVIEAFSEAAKRYAQGGYDVIVDGVIGPWFLEPWLKIVQAGYEVHYIILRASKKETIKRAAGRSKLDRETNILLVEIMGELVHTLATSERSVIDPTAQPVEDTAAIVI